MTQDFTSVPMGHQLTPEEIEHRPFPPVRKGGVDEDSVRSFLRDVAAFIEQRTAQFEAREQALESQVAQLREELQTPPVPTGQRLVELVGEEVARTLRTAQESADEMQSKAEERAARIWRDAQEETQRGREVEIEQARQDARAMVEAARERGREMVGEARALRERVLTDLNRRREALQAQVEELRANREQVAATYRSLKQTFDEASGAFVRFEASRPFDSVVIDVPPPPLLPPERHVEPVEPRADARGAALELGELPATPAAAPATEPAAEAETAPARAPEHAAGAIDESAPEPQPEPEPAPPAEPAPPPEAAPPAEPAPPPEAAPAPTLSPSSPSSPTPFGDALRELRKAAPPEDAGEAVSPGGGRAPSKGVPDLDEIFRRIRAGRSGESPTPTQPEAEPRQPKPSDRAPDQPDTAGAAGAAPTAAAPDGPATRTVTIAPEAPAEPEVPGSAEADADARALAARDELLATVSIDVVRSSKRMLQDDQNVLLDRLRRQRRGISAEKVFPPVADQITAWADMLAPALDQTYAAARATAPGDRAGGAGAPRRLVTAMAEALVSPLRDRVVAAVSDGGEADPDPDVIATRIGARYREWKGQELEARIGDILAATYARGIYDAAPEGSQLRWIPAEHGKCSDCDDNALEPTVRGNRFPTGQPFPPAHPGCRCLLEVVQ